MASEKKISYVLSMKDGTTSTLNKVHKSLRKTRTAMKGVSESLTRMTIIGTGVGRMFGKINRAASNAVKGTVGEFIKFEKGMAEVATITDLSTAEMASLGREVQKFSSQYAVDATEAAKALYMTISAGTPATNGGAQAFAVMGEALRFGKTALVDAATSVDLITTVLNSYGMKAEEVKRVSDILFTTIKQGKTTGEELAGSLGRVTPIAAAAGVSLEDLSAAAVMLTRAGLSTDEAMTSLRGLLVSIVKPTEKSAKAIEKLNLQMFDEAVLKTDGGLFKVLEELQVATKGNVGELAELVPNVRALTGALAAAGQQKDLPDILDSLRNSTGVLDEALGKMMNTFGFQVEQLFAKMTSLRTRWGELVARSSVLRQAFVDIGNSVDETLESLNDGSVAAVSFTAAIDRFVGIALPAAIDGLAVLIQTIGIVGNALLSLIDWVEESADKWEGFKEKVSAFYTFTLALNPTLLSLVSLQKEQAEVTEEQSAAMFEFNSVMDSSVERLEKLADSIRGYASKAKESNKEAVENAKTQEVLIHYYDKLKDALGFVTNKYSEYIERQRQAVLEKARAADAADKLKTEFKNLAGFVKKVWDVHLVRFFNGEVAATVEQMRRQKEMAEAVETAYNKLKKSIIFVGTKIVNQASLMKDANAEFDLQNQLANVQGENWEEIEATRRRIIELDRVTKEAAEANIIDEQAFIDVKMQTFDLQQQMNALDDENRQTQEERIRNEERIRDEYTRSIEALSTGMSDAFAGIFEQWASGQQSLSDGLDGFTTRLREQLTSAFLDPLIGADSFMTELFKGMFDWASQLGKKMAETIKGWFVEKATQRTIDATVGAATHAASASKQALTTMASVAAIMPALSAAAAAALIATFGGAAANAAMLPGLLASASATGVSFAAMAEGGFVESPTFALVGEAGAEVVIPETRTERARELLGQLANRRPELFASDGQQLSSPTINISVTGGADENIAETIADEVDRVLGRRMGL